MSSGYCSCSKQCESLCFKPISSPSGCNKRILRYLAGTVHVGLKYVRSDNMGNTVSVTAHTDAGWDGDHVDRRSTTGYVIRINNCTVSWACKKQPTIAISSAEAEYMAIAAGVQELLWTRQFLS